MPYQQRLSRKIAVPAGTGQTDSEKGEELSWPKRRKLAHAPPWEYSCKGRELAQLLGQSGGFLTCSPGAALSF